MDKKFLDILGTEYKEPEINEKAIKIGTNNKLELDASVWAVSGRVWLGTGKTADVLQSGVYECCTRMDGTPYLLKQEVSVDKLIDLPDDPTTEVLDHITDFWSRENKFEELGFVYKRGILLYGPQGSGKSSTIFRLMKQIIASDGIALIVNSPYAAISCINLIREIEPDRKLVVLMEDVDDIVYCYGDRTLTNLLDGSENVNRVVFVATTNYPERLPPRLLQRPSRFDIVKYIGMPTLAARLKYIKTVLKGKASPSIIENLADKTEEMSIAQIKEVILLVVVFEIEIEEAINRVKNLGVIGEQDVTRNRYRELSQEDTNEE